jgi:hypothetical protein
MDVSFFSKFSKNRSIDILLIFARGRSDQIKLIFALKVQNVRTLRALSIILPQNISPGKVISVHHLRLN